MWSYVICNDMFTVFQRNIDAIEVEAFGEVVLGYVWNDSARRVANEARRQYALTLGQG